MCVTKGARPVEQELISLNDKSEESNHTAGDVIAVVTEKIAKRRKAEIT